MEKQESEFLVLAALLHDVGKFAQRAKAPLSAAMEDTYCPQASYGSSHKHVLYTDYFVENELPLPRELEGRRSLLARIASAHHKPDAENRLEKCLQQGDWLASGNDRIADDSKETYLTARLESIFARVHLRDDTAATQQDGNAAGQQSNELLRYPLKALDDRDIPIFPVPGEKARKTLYEELYASFLQAVRNIPVHMGTAHFLSSFMTVLERFTWCIPSSTYKTRADISLYDHCYTTAAIAQALYLGEQPVHSLQQTDLLLLGGELSGIQNFIFGQGEQGDRGASKLLRARSFSLQMLTRSIWQILLERCGINPVARIMDAGGRFILLLPDTEAVRQEVDRLEAEALRYVLEKFNGILRITFAQHSFPAHALKISSFPDVYKELNDKLEQAKLRPLSPLLQHSFSPVLGIPSSAYASFGTCPFCDLRPAEGSSGDDAGCSICKTLIQQVGRRLPTARYALLTRKAGGFPLFDGLYLRLEEKLDASDAQALEILSLKDRAAYTAAPVAGYVPRISEDDRLRWTASGQIRETEDEPWEKNAPKTFDMLASEARIPTAKGFRSIACLAACKADVDNLGLLFGIGLEHGEGNHFSLSRFAMLSRMMHHFFSSCLIEIMTEKFPNIYVVFAGGDDLFVLGPWSDIVKFAALLHKTFTDFTGGSADVTISAGVALAKSGVPMRVIKNLAEEALEASKSRCEEKNNTQQEQCGSASKNAVTLFGVTCPWKEFAPRLAQGEWLEQLCLDGLVTQGFVRRLLGYSRQARAFDDGDIASGLYRSHMVYDMSRNISEEKNFSPDDWKRLHALCHDKDFKNMELSVTWALYRTRTSL